MIKRTILLYMISKSVHPVKSGIGPVSEFPSSHLTIRQVDNNDVGGLNYYISKLGSKSSI